MAAYGLKPVKRVDGMPYAGATRLYKIDPAGEATTCSMDRLLTSVRTVILL